MFLQVEKPLHFNSDTNLIIASAPTETKIKPCSLFCYFKFFLYLVYNRQSKSDAVQIIVYETEYLSEISNKDNFYQLTDTGQDSKLVRRLKRPKTDTLFSSLFWDAFERRVWLNAELKILASTFGRFRLYRLRPEGRHSDDPARPDRADHAQPDPGTSFFFHCF